MSHTSTERPRPNFDEYIAAWRLHAGGEQRTLDRLLAQTAPGYFYEDIHLPPYVGAEGLARVWATAHEFFLNLQVEISGRAVSTTAWSVEWTAVGVVRASETSFAFRGVWFGEFAPTGYVSRHVDYYSIAQLEAQVGQLG